MKNKKSILLFKSWNGNHYLLNLKKKNLLYCHPLLYYYIDLFQKKGIKELREFYTLNFNKKKIKIENLGEFSGDEVQYYYKKFYDLLENKLLEDFNSNDKISGLLNENTVFNGLKDARQITFEVTERCNMKCTYCGYGEFYDDYSPRENKYFPISNAKNILNYFHTLWGSSNSIIKNRKINIGFYGGEPLLNFSFIKEIVAFTKKWEANNQFQVSYSMTSNGTLIRKYMDFLAKHKIRLSISLDGNEKNNEYRVFKDSTPIFHKVLDNLLLLKKNYPEYFNSHVNFIAVLQNKNSVEEIYEFFKSKFSKTATIVELNNSGIKENQLDRFNETFSFINQSLYQSKNVEIIENDMFHRLPNTKKIASLFNKYNPHAYQDYNEMIFPPGSIKNMIPTGTCLPFSKKVFITVKGKILPCERIGHHHQLGYVDDQHVQIHLKEISDKYNRYLENLNDLCNSCYNNLTCQQCIFNMLMENGKLKCNGFMGEKDYRQYISNIISHLEENPNYYNRITKDVVID